MFRSAMLEHALRQRGHRVVRVVSLFDHFAKRSRDPNLLNHNDFLWVRTPGYRKNVSLARLFDHHVAGKNAGRMIRALGDRFDLLIGCLPTVESAALAVRLSKRMGAASLIDVRDLWPKLLVDQFPKSLRGFARFALGGMQQTVERSLRRSDSVVAVSDSYLDFAVRMRGGERRGTDQVIGPCRDRIFESRDAGELKRQREIAFVGNFLSQNGVDLEEAIRGFLREPGKATAWKLVLIGDGPRFPELYAKFGHESRVEFCGRLGDEALCARLKSATLGLIPYSPTSAVGQGVPNKLVDYLAAGCGLLFLGERLGEAALGRPSVVSFGWRVDESGSLGNILHRVECEGDELESNALRLFDQEFSSDSVMGRYATHCESLFR